MSLMIPSLSINHDPKLLVLFLDGFRWDYVANLSHTESLKNFRRFHFKGSTVERVKPVFPTDCYPNIYSIFTGKLPSEHGVLFNEMYNSINGDAFYHEQETTRHIAPNWVHADTLWHQVNKQGKKTYLHQLPICVPGNDTNEAKQCVAYNKANMTLDGFKRAIDRALSKLMDDDFQFAVAYHDSMDQLAHKHGPMSKHIIEEHLPALDRVLGHALDRIDASSVRYNLNLAVVSDHGLAHSEDHQPINIDRLMLFSDVKRISNRGSTFSLWVKPDRHNKILEKFKNMGDHKFNFYTADTLPKSWRTGHFSQFFPSFYLMAHPGHYFSYEVPKKQEPEASPFSLNDTLKKRRGWHGYHPDRHEMHTPLLLYGPRVRKGVRLVVDDNPVSVLSVYHVLAELLHLPSQSDLPHVLLHPRKKTSNFYLIAANGMNIAVAYYISLLILFLTFLSGIILGRNWNLLWRSFVKRRACHQQSVVSSKMKTCGLDNVGLLDSEYDEQASLKY